MNVLISEEFPLAATQSLCYELLALLTDEDLAYKLPGDNPTLGELCREHGDIEHIYIRSFTTFRTDWSLRSSEVSVAGSVDQLKNWFEALDHEFEEVIRTFSDADLTARTIDRGKWSPTAFVQFQIYREAVLIFLAQAGVYLRALRKPLSDHWRQAIG